MLLSRLPAALSALRPLILIVLAAALAACAPQNQGYLANGIGARLPAADIARSTTLLSRYFDHLCQQAGLSGVPHSVPAPRCPAPVYDRGFWTLIVSQGMNDIDRRCDAYLEWLDNQRRSKAPLLSQINAIQTATNTIIEVVSPGSAGAMSIVAQAFSLLTKSIENYHSRLLLEIESSTVNSIVLLARRDFRKKLRDDNIVFRSKPEAEHALRSYLRLCLPFAIETNINVFSTLGAAGEAPGEENMINTTPVVGAVIEPGAGFGTRPNGRPPQPPPVPGPDLAKVFKGTGFVEADLKKLQRVFCLQEHGIGSVGDKTLASVRIFEQSEAEFPRITVDEKIDSDELDLLSGLPDCDNRTYRNFYERTQLETAPKVQGLIALLNARTPGAALDPTLPLSNADVRKRIAVARKQYGLPDYEGFAADHVTKELFRLLRLRPAQ